MFSKRIWPLTAVVSMDLPSVDSASISGVDFNSLRMSEPAPLADEISGTKENTFPAWIAPKVVLFEKITFN